MEICTNLQKKFLDLETSKTAQEQEILSLKQKVKKLEKKKKSRPHRLRRLYKGRIITDLDADVEVTLIYETQGKNDDNLMFDTGVLDGQEVMADKDVSTAKVTTASATTTTDELTLAQTLIEIKAAKPKAVTTVATPIVSSSQPSQVKDKGKAKMVKEEHVKKFLKKEQIRLDQELAFKLQLKKKKK
ncbi:hypothetical protein Tco_0496684 [Tanacetum coccineum]